MRNALVMIGLCIVLGFAGCTTLDSFFGSDTQNPGGPGTPAGAVGSIVSTWVPWSSAAMALLGGLWTLIRGNKYKSVLMATLQGLAEVQKAKQNDGKITADEIPAIIAAVHAKLGTDVSYQQILDTLKNV